MEEAIWPSRVGSPCKERKQPWASWISSSEASWHLAPSSSIELTQGDKKVFVEWIKAKNLNVILKPKDYKDI